MQWTVATVGTSAFGLTTNEHRAIADLTALGFASYAPRTIETVTKRGIRRQKISPLFPGYLFAELTPRWPDLLTAYHVRGLLMAGESPACVAQEVIDELHQRERPDGLIPCAGARRRRWRPGRIVQVRHGVLIGLSGRIDVVLEGGSADRIRVLFDLLGRQTPVTLLESEVAAPA